MNINSFTSEADDSRGTPPRRVSARKKAPLAIDSHCFKRPYKWVKSRAENNTASFDVKSNCESNEDQIVSRLITVLFDETPRSKKQAKAIHTFRIKKTKKMIAQYDSLASKDGPPEASESLLALLKSRPKNSPCVGRSLFAMSRARNPQGKFQSHLELQKSVTATDQIVDDWCSVNHTTAACSQVELTGDGPNNRSQHDLFSCLGEFLSITESSDKDYMGSTAQNYRVSGLEEYPSGPFHGKHQGEKVEQGLSLLSSRVETIHPEYSLLHFLDGAMERTSLLESERMDRLYFESLDKDHNFH
jgi:hypothetical protein